VFLQQKIHKCVVHDLMDEYDEIRIIVHPKTNFRSTYSTSPIDGRVIINGWKDLLKKYNLIIGDRMIFVIHHGREGVFFFVTAMPEEE
jgi:hypothetical protein